MQGNTIKTILASAHSLLSPLDRELLLAHVLGKPREFVVAHPEWKLGNLIIWQFGRLVKKREKGIPLAYLTHHKEFYGLDFFVNTHVLIPRPETEMMVDLAVSRLQISDFRVKQNQDNSPNSSRRRSGSRSTSGEVCSPKSIFIDVGTGSGCIPIAIAKTIQKNNATMQPRNNVTMFAIDISKKALRVAKKNAKKHTTDITFLHGNLLKPINPFISLFPNFSISQIIITANLPYLTQAQFDEEPSIHHEPKSALVAANNGLALYEELLQQIQPKADPSFGGQSLISSFQFPVSLLLEIDPTQSTPIQSLIKTYFPTAKITLHQDLAGKDRVIRMEIDPSVDEKTPIC